VDTLNMAKARRGGANQSRGIGRNALRGQSIEQLSKAENCQGKAMAWRYGAKFCEGMAKQHNDKQKKQEGKKT
jgi:hypothetical protein